MSALQTTQGLCVLIMGRLDAQRLRGIKTRSAAALHMLTGAAAVLHVIGSDQYSSVATLAWLTAARGVEVVEKISKGESL